MKHFELSTVTSLLLNLDIHNRENMEVFGDF